MKRVFRSILWPFLSSLLLFLPAHAIMVEPAFAEATPWLSRLDDAVERAARDDRYILIDLYAEWCGFCQVLEKDVFSTPAFRAFAQDFVLLRVDTQDGGEGGRLRTQYGARTLPTMLILDARQVKIGAVTGVSPSAEYIESLRSEIERFGILLKAYDKARESDRIDLQRQLAEEFHSRMDGSRAASLYEQVLLSTDEESRDGAWLYYYIADSYRIGHKFDKARQNLDRGRALATRLEDERLVERCDLLNYYIARNGGDCEQAIGSLQHYLEHHPKTEASRDARRFLDKLERGIGMECK